MTSKNLLSILSLGLLIVLSCTKEENNSNLLPTQHNAPDSTSTSKYPITYGGNVNKSYLLYEPSPWGNLYHWDTIFSLVYVERTIEKDLYGDFFTKINMSGGPTIFYFEPDSTLVCEESVGHAHNPSSDDSIFMIHYGDSLYYERKFEGPSNDYLCIIEYKGMLYAQ